MFRRKAWGGKRLVSDLTCADKCDPKWGRGRRRGIVSPGYGHLRRPHPGLCSVTSNEVRDAPNGADRQYYLIVGAHK